MTTTTNQTTDQSRNQTVELSRLTASKDNVRRVESEAGLTADSDATGRVIQ